MPSQDFLPIESEESLDTLTINQNYADKFERRKRGEELSQLKEKYGAEAMNSMRYQDFMDEDEDEDDSDEEDEDEDGELVTPEIDVQILKTIAKIRNKDPEVYNPEKKFFTEQDVAAVKESLQTRKKVTRNAWSTHRKTEKPMHLKDYHRQRLLQGDIEESETKTELTHVQEQELLKEEFKTAIQTIDDDDNEDLFKKRTKDEKTLQQEEEDYRNFLLQHMASEKASGWEDWKKLNEGKQVDENEAFLMNYVLNKGWVDKEAKSKIPTYEEIVAEEQDEEEVEKMEDFERVHNFRYEEENCDTVQTHSRNIVNSVRREDDRRKKAREKLKQKKAEAKQQKAEELKRMKNLKKQEILNKLKKIHTMAGVPVDEALEKAANPEDAMKKLLGFGQEDIEGEFDPEAHDKKMQDIFNDNYYNMEEDENQAPLKPVFDDDIDIADIVEPEESESKLLDRKKKHTDSDDDFIMDADYLPGGEHYDENENQGELNQEEKKSIKQSLDKYLEEYYQLDYEDMIGDLPTRFKYASVPQENFGLDPVEILLADDSQLNQLVSIKKLAPFRRQESVAKDMDKFRKSKKKRLREFRKSLIEQVEEELKQGPILSEKDTQKKKKKKADKEKAALEMKEKAIKSTMSQWLERIKSKRLEGRTEADIQAHEAKEKKDKKRKRAEEYKNKAKKEDVEEEGTKRPKVSKDRLKTYAL